MVLQDTLSSEVILPVAASNVLLVGCVWSNAPAGACPVPFANGRLLDLSSLAPTSSALLEMDCLTRHLENTSSFADIGNRVEYSDTCPEWTSA